MVDVPDWSPIASTGDDLVAAVADRAVRHPELPAVVCSTGATLTYGALLDRAVAAAPALRDADRGRGVTVCAGHDPVGSVAVLAAAVAGVRLALVDTGDPAERREALVAALGLPVLAADQLLSGGGAVEHRVRLSGVPDLIAATSGSTSAPKIAALPASRWGSDLEQADRIHRRCQLLVAGVGSYAYLNMICSSWLAGGTAALFDVHERTTSDLAGFLRSERVTSLAATPTLVQALGRVSDPLPDITLVRIRGERVSGVDLAAVHELAPNAVVRHLYASTEAGLIASHLWLPGDPPIDGVLPLTALAGGCQLATLGDDGRAMLGVGEVPAELLVRTPSMIAGYLGGGDDALFVDAPDGRWMRTGDLAISDERSGVRVLGRVGRRVKVAGMFVDLDEVAVHLEREPGVVQAAVTSFDDGDTLRLVGHLVAADGAAVDPVAVRAHLAGRLPVHMVPSLVRVVDSPPRNASGKLDHLALAGWRPTPADVDDRVVATDVASPTEALVVTVASELSDRQVGVDTDLVDAGFTSLDWLELVERLRLSFGCELDVVHLFGAPTPRGIAAAIGDRRDVPLVLLAAGRQRPVLVWALLGLAAQEAVPLARSSNDRPVWVPVPKGFTRPGRRAWAVREVVADMVEAIESSPERGPLVVVGFSTGCHFARGVASSLVARGREVPLLVLLDPLRDRRNVWGRLRREARYWVDRRALARDGLDLAERHRALFRVQVRQTAGRRPAGWGGPVLLVRSSAHLDEPIPAGLTGPVRVEVFEGGHHDVIADGPRLATAIERALDDARRSAR